METLHIFLGLTVAFLIAIGILAYLVFKEAKSIVAANQKIANKIDEVITIKTAGDQKIIEMFAKLLEENRNNSNAIVDFVGNSFGKIHEVIDSKITQSIEARNSGDQQKLAALNSLLEENLNIHKTLQEVIDLENELSNK